jgi:hypothetical protein
MVRLGVKSQLDLLQEQELLQYAAFLPGGAGVVFVQNNDLYHLDSLPDGKVTRITSSGIAGTLYNGVADWLYEGKQKRLNVLRVLLNNSRFCNGFITKRDFALPFTRKQILCTL